VPNKRRVRAGKAGKGVGAKPKSRSGRRQSAAKKPPVRTRHAAAADDRPEPPREREQAETLIRGAADDDLAEELGEESVEAATSGQTPAEDNFNAEVPEETGGPFVEVSAEKILCRGPRRRK
jgi:hypothetical protein